MRPLILYRFRFDHSLYESFEVEAAGVSPCAAKDVAFERLEAFLRDKPDAPRDEWRMGERTPLRQIEP